MPFWGAVRIRTSTGNYVSPVRYTGSAPTMGTISNYEATYNGDVNVTVECDYTHPTLDALLGFKVWIGSVPSPDWDSATDVGLTGGDAGSPVEHFTWNLTTSAIGTVYFAIQAYGNDGEDDLYVNTPVFNININPTLPVLNTPFDVTASTQADDRLDIEWKYEHPEFDKLEGFKVWVSDNPVPDWDTAYDNGLLNGDSVSPVETFNMPYTYGDFGTTYVAIQAYGDGETKESEVFEFEHVREKVLFPPNITHIAKPSSGTVRVVFDYLWASYDTIDDVNMLEGFKISVSTDPIPNWTTAYDNGLSNGSGKPSGGGLETFDVTLSNSDTGIVFFTIQSYGEGQTRETRVARVFAETETATPEMELNVDAPMMDLPLRQRTQLCATPTGHLSPAAWVGDKIIGWTKIATFGNVVGAGLTTVTNNGYVMSVDTPDIRLMDNTWVGENVFENLVIGDSHKLWFVKDEVDPSNNRWIEWNPTDSQFEMYVGKLFLPGGSLNTDEINVSVANADNFYGDGSGITDIDASNIATGTIDNARLPTTAQKFSGEVTIINGDNYAELTSIPMSAGDSLVVSYKGASNGGGALWADTDTIGGWNVFSTNPVGADTTVVWRVLKN